MCLACCMCLSRTACYRQVCTQAQVEHKTLSKGNRGCQQDSTFSKCAAGCHTVTCMSDMAQTKGGGRLCGEALQRLAKPNHA
jgi:hypothetical protein